MKEILQITGLFILMFAPLHSQTYLEMIDSGEYTVAEIKSEADRYFSGRDLGQGSGYFPYQRWLHMAQRLQDEHGYLPNTLQRIEEIQNYDAYLNESAGSRTNLFGVHHIVS